MEQKEDRVNISQPEFKVGETVSLYNGSLGTIVKIITISTGCIKYEVNVNGIVEIKIPNSIFKLPPTPLPITVPQIAPRKEKTKENTRIDVKLTKEEAKEHLVSNNTYEIDIDDDDDDEPRATEEAENQAALDEEEFYQNLESKEETKINDTPSDKNDDKQSSKKRKKAEKEPEDPLKPNKQEWKSIDKHGIKTEVATSNIFSKINWNGLFNHLSDTERISSPKNYFLLAFSPISLDNIIKGTLIRIKQSKEECKEKNIIRTFYEFNINKLYKYIGMLIIMTLDPLRGGEKSYFKQDFDTRIKGVSEDFHKKLKMSYHEFEFISHHICFNSDGNIENDQDCWYPIRGFVNEFNERRERIIQPGKYICVDELMSQWEGLESEYQLHGIPHLTKIPRKPKSVGTEFKSAADVETGVIIRLEIQEGKEANNAKEFQDRFPFHTAVTLRLLKPWFNTGRICIADSAFSSFLTAITLLSFGFYFLGAVKTATKSFPIDYFKSWFENKPERGDHKVCITTKEIMKNGSNLPCSIYALGWMSKVPKTYVATCGTTLQGFEHKVKGSVVRSQPENGRKECIKYINSTPCPELLNNLYRGFNTIDVHDHYRQGTLQLEVNIRTHYWWKRLFNTILGVILTDSYFLYRHEYNQLSRSFPMLDYVEFMYKLANELIMTEGNDQRMLRKPIKEETSLPSALLDYMFTNHPLLSLHDTPYYDNNKHDHNKRTCSYCPNHPVYFCATCSRNMRATDKTFDPFVICFPSNKNFACYIKHLHTCST